MDSIQSGFNLDDEQKIFFSSSTETKTPQDNFEPNANEARMAHMSSPSEGAFYPASAQFQGRAGNDLLHFLAQQEPSHADTAPSALDIEMMNFQRMNGQNMPYGDVENNPRNFFMGGSNSNRSESVASTQPHLWTETSSTSGAARTGEVLDSFDFLIKSLSSANNYVSMLSREQLYLLRSIRPNLLYEFLQEVAKVRVERRLRRALPHECAFCKNNGENEECYSSHPLKDWRGRVLCPVLRAFRCPRCGATGDRAHTIKYCPENADNASDQSSVSGRRRRAAMSLVLGSGSVNGAAGARTQPPTPTPSPSANMQHSNHWFGMN